MFNNLKKFLYILFTIFLAATLLFFIIRFAPGDPVERILGPEASLDEITLYREQLGLSQPLLSQYINFLKGIVLGNLGFSLFKNVPVISLIQKRLAPTIILAILSIFFSTFFGIALGTLSAVNKKKITDNFLRIFTLLLLAFPIFSLAPLLVLIFSIKLTWFPVSEWGEPKHIVLPALTIILPLSSVISKIMRNIYLEEVHAPWVQVLRAKGLSEFSITLRIIKVCLPTIFNIVALQLSVVLAGTMVTETIFDLPGLGSLLFESIQNRDYPIVQGIVIYSTVVYMLIYFLIDHFNSYIDPRLSGVNNE